jgi:hypothetical protein
MCHAKLFRTRTARLNRRYSTGLAFALSKQERQDVVRMPRRVRPPAIRRRYADQIDQRCASTRYDRNCRREFCPVDHWLQRGIKLDLVGADEARCAVR